MFPPPVLKAQGYLATKSDHRIKGTIVVPTFKRPEYLRECLEELSKQINSLHPFKVVIWDNNSGDKTLEIACSYAQRIPWLRVYTRKLNAGAIRNTMHINMLVDTEYAWWLTDDDILQPDAAEHVYSILTSISNSINWIISPLATYDSANGDPISIIEPSANTSDALAQLGNISQARHAWAYSRQIWRTEYIKLRIMEIEKSKHLRQSGYWMVYPASKAIQESSAYRTRRILVRHLYGNETYWQCIHPDERKLRSKLDTDYIYTFALSANETEGQVLPSMPALSDILQFLDESYRSIPVSMIFRQALYIIINSTKARRHEAIYASSTLICYIVARATMKRRAWLS